MYNNETRPLVLTLRKSQLRVDKDFKTCNSDAARGKNQEALVDIAIGEDFQNSTRSL